MNRPSGQVNGSKCQVKFDAALVDFNPRQFKTRVRKMAAQVDFCMFLNAALSCLQLGALVLIKDLLT